MKGNGWRSDVDRKWSKAEHAAHSKNKREWRLLESCITDLARNQYLAKLRYREQIRDIRESIWPLRSNTGYAHLYLEKIVITNAERGVYKERFIGIVRQVIKLLRDQKELLGGGSDVAYRRRASFDPSKTHDLHAIPNINGPEELVELARHPRDVNRSSYIPSGRSKLSRLNGTSDCQTKQTPTGELQLPVDTSSSSKRRYEVYDIDFSALAIGQNKAGRSTTIIGRGPLSLPKCLEYQQCLINFSSQTFAAALTKKLQSGTSNKNEITIERSEDLHSGKKRSDVQRVRSGISLSRYVRAVESGLPMEHLTPRTRDIPIPVSGGLAKRERIKMMKELRRPRTTSDLEKRRTKLIQEKIDSFLHTLPLRNVPK